MPRRPTPGASFPLDGKDLHGLRNIEESTCRRLLANERIGRLGLSVGSLPVIFPVNYALDADRAVFCSEPGEKVTAAEHGDVACLQIDQFDRFEHSGWSVLATGVLSIAPAERVERYERLPVVPWALHGDVRYLELGIELVSGRAIAHPNAAPPTTSAPTTTSRSTAPSAPLE